ncbi:hypothetical protein DMENIID0001_155840 [Sergentomyia squamirostris]
MFFGTIIVFLLYLNHLGGKCLGERILAVFPVPCRSNAMVGDTLVLELANRGHQVTYLSPFRLRQKRENIGEIFIEGAEEFYQNDEKLKNLYQYPSVLEEITQTIYSSAELVNFTLSHAAVQKLLRSDATFDLLLLDSFMMDALLGFAYHYRVPSVVVSTRATNKWTDEYVGNPHNPAYNPNLFLGFSSRMTFPERILNSLMSVFLEFTYQYLYLPGQEAIYQRFFGPLQSKNSILPPLDDLIHNVSSVLINTHPGFHYPQALLPKLVEIGGIHIPKPKTLPDDIQRFFTLATGGVVVFSLGSHLRSVDLAKDKRDAFNKVFKGMPDVGIFWKWEDRKMPEQADNVIIGPWLPQFDLLSHNNTKLLITHGGILSVYEAMYSGTPVLGIPLHGDQGHNLQMAVEAGFGRILSYDNLSEDIIKEAVEDMLKNPTYLANAERFAKLVRHNSIPVVDRAVYQVEMVLRTGGAPHLRSANLDLATWQIYLVDVTLCIVIMCLVILAIPAVIIGIVLRRSANAAVVASKKPKSRKTSSDKIKKLK